MSAIGTYNYDLAKFMVPFLQSLTGIQYTVHSSFSVAKELTSCTSSVYNVMVSFGVVSLFTNIPLDETVNIILDGLFNEADTIGLDNCSFNTSQFKKFLKFAVKDSHFMLNNQLYEQIDGVAMGSPLRLSLANIFMRALKQNFLSLLYRRYVDDTFCIFQNRVQAKSFLQYLNQQHPKISFTHEYEHEYEDNNSLPFLDVLIMHADNGFSSNLYRKKH